MQLPHKTPQQQKLLIFLFSFRYLNRRHVQQYFGHQTPSHTNRLLKDLTEKKYVRRIALSEELSANSQPTIYCVGSKAIGFIAAMQNRRVGELKNRYKDHIRTTTYITHQLLLAEIFLQLKQSSEGKKMKLTFLTKSNFEEGSVLQMLHPDAYVVQENNDDKKLFFLELIDPITPRFVIRKRIRQYIKYFLNNSVEVEIGEPYPTVLFICPTNQLQRYLLKYLSTCLVEEGADDLICKVATVEKVKKLGITGEIWQRAGE